MVKKAGALAVLMLIAMIAWICANPSDTGASAEVKEVRPSMSAIATPTK